MYKTHEKVICILKGQYFQFLLELPFHNSPQVIKIISLELICLSVAASQRAFAMKLLQLVKPLIKYVPEVASPDRRVSSACSSSCAIYNIAATLPGASRVECSCGYYLFNSC